MSVLKLTVDLITIYISHNIHLRLKRKLMPIILSGRNIRHTSKTLVIFDSKEKNMDVLQRCNEWVCKKASH